MSDETPDWAHSFGGVAEAYERGRPTYPADAVQWMVGDQPSSVLELGAGTGKLTRVLVSLGHDVHATDPDAEMLAILEEQVPGTRTAVASAEDIPLADRSVDVVIAAQAFHWFDLDRALPEIARVLRPGGRLCLVWNQRNEKIPWVRRLGALIGTQEQLTRPRPGADLQRALRFRRGARVQPLADRRPQDDPGPRAVALQRRGARRRGTGRQAGRGARVLRRLRPRHGRHAAALRDALLHRHRPRPPDERQFRPRTTSPATASAPTTRTTSC